MNEPWTICPHCQASNIVWGLCVKCGKELPQAKQPPKSKTPLTDEEANDDYMINIEGNNEIYVASDFARSLEIRLNEALDEVKHLREAVAQTNEISNHLSDACQQRDEALAKLAEAMKDKEFPETHRQGHISIENADFLKLENLQDADFGVQISIDGRVWCCINGIAFIRFKPKRTAIDAAMKGGEGV